MSDKQIEMGATNLTRAQVAKHLGPVRAARIGLRDGAQSLAVDVYMDVAIASADELGVEDIVRIEVRVVWDRVGAAWLRTDVDIQHFGGVPENEFRRRCTMTPLALEDEAERVARLYLVETASAIEMGGV